MKRKNPAPASALRPLLLAAAAFLVLRLTEKKRRSTGKYAPKVVHIERLCEKAQQNHTNE